jgi:hypothetical protein
MKTPLVFLVSQILFLGIFPLSSVHAQKKALNIAGIHQLVADSKSEYNLQNQARDRQAVTTANEQANKTLLAKLKTKYRDLQERYQVLGMAIQIADLGIRATPMLEQIVRNQTRIYELAHRKPVLMGIAYHAEREFVNKARSLLNYLMGLCASIGAVNQMKASDRRILFDYVLAELSGIQSLSANLAGMMAYSSTAGSIRSLNPFAGYVDTDKQLVGEIIRNAKFLR